MRDGQVWRWQIRFRDVTHRASFLLLSPGRPVKPDRARLHRRGKVLPTRPSPPPSSPCAAKLYLRGPLLRKRKGARHRYLIGPRKSQQRCRRAGQSSDRERVRTRPCKNAPKSQGRPLIALQHVAECAQSHRGQGVTASVRQWHILN